ncbi:MAG: tetratricopeptide repeat protein, partial [Pseudolabrys sp.]
MALLQSSRPFNVPQAVQQALDLHRQGKLPQAEKLYSDILAVRPDYFEALHMLGLVKVQRGDFAGALHLMLGALKARPKSPEVLLNYATVLNGLGRYDEALDTLGQVLSIKRRSVEAYNNRGAVLERLGRDEEARADFLSALEIKSSHVDALYNLGSVLRKLGRYPQAIKALDRALAIKPDYAKAHNNRGAALEAMEKPAEALLSYDRALALESGFVEAINNRGSVLQKLGHPGQALAGYERALAINPGHAEVLYNHSCALAMVGRHQEALASCSKAIVANPNYVNAQWNDALLRLRLGDYSGGFEKYEWRWKRAENAKRLRNFAQPLWLGHEPIEGRTVLLHAEQGFGDTIQFVRFATVLVQRGARVILEVQPPLVSLLSQIGAGIQVIGHGETIPVFDMHCPLLSVPRALRTELGTIPSDVPYLNVASDRTAHWAARLPKGKRLRVGLVWSGNAVHKDDHNRSIS